MPSNSSSDSGYDPNSRPDPEIVLKLSLDMDIVWSRLWNNNNEFFFKCFWLLKSFNSLLTLTCHKKIKAWFLKYALGSCAGNIAFGLQ